MTPKPYPVTEKTSRVPYFGIYISGVWGFRGLGFRGLGFRDIDNSLKNRTSFWGGQRYILQLLEASCLGRWGSSP